MASSHDELSSESDRRQYLLESDTCNSKKEKREGKIHLKQLPVQIRFKLHMKLQKYIS